MSTRFLGRLTLVVCGALGLGLAAGGCLGGDDTSVAPTFDAAFPTFDAAIPFFDAGTESDSASPVDAAPDAPVDAGLRIDAAAVPGSQTGLAGAGTVSASPSYLLVGSTGPATAPVLRSPHYQLVGSMAVTTPLTSLHP